MLQRLLRSIFEQTYLAYEVIIADDSPDASVESVISQYRHMPMLRYYRNQERKGSPDNWNVAIRHASGKYIKILHHDDWFSQPDSLRKYVDMLDTNPSANFAFSSSSAYKSDGTLLSVNLPTFRQIEKLRRNPAYLFPYNFVGAPSATIYRNSPSAFFDVRLKYVVDIDFYIRMLMQNSSFVYCKEPLINVNSGGSGQVTSLCEKDRKIQLFEWSYLYKKLNSPMSPRQIKFMWSLLSLYMVRSVHDLVDVGVDLPIPPTIKSIIYLQKILPSRNEWGVCGKGGK